MTGADRAWAARYEPGDVLHYNRGSKEIGIESRSYARVVVADSQTNLLTVERPNGEHVTYDPSRLRGIAAYRGIERKFAEVHVLDIGGDDDADRAGLRGAFQFGRCGIGIRERTV